MQQETFTNVGWDFLGESANGDDDVWRMCYDNVTSPRLSWESPAGDFNCPDGLGVEDLAVIAVAWLAEDYMPIWNPKADLKPDGIIDLHDLKRIAENWLAQ